MFRQSAAPCPNASDHASSRYCKMDSGKLTIFAVDDDLPSRIMLQAIFADGYDVEIFEAAEACLERVQTVRPGLFLLNVGLPGIDGFEMCRRLKSDALTAHIPVIFISRKEDTETRLTGYDAGGEDFLVKPYAIDEVRRKVDVVRKAVANAAALRQRIGDSEKLAVELLTNLGEYAVVIGFVQNLNQCNSNEEIAEALLKALRAYQLEGAVQVLSTEGQLTLSEEGRDRPIECSVIESVRGLGRIVEFKRRLACNFDSLTVLVKNMPLHDATLCARIRDNLLIAAECANARIQAQQHQSRHSQSKTTASNAFDALQAVIFNFRSKYSQALYQSSLQTQGLLDELAAAFASLGLSAEQENRIDDIVRTRMEQMSTIYDFSDEMYASLSAVARQFAEILNTSPQADGGTQQATGDDVELF
jgi:DNA-binding response OmpR family regulator